MSYKDKTNSEIIVEIKKMELNHDNLKTKISSLLDELEEIEKNYQIAINELTKRGINNVK